MEPLRGSMQGSAAVPIVVLGMHRSGTSALANVIGRLGAALGTDADVSDGSENKPIRACNAAILDALGGHWSAPVGFEPGWTNQPEVVELDAQVRSALDRLPKSGVFAWKDPRTCFTFGFWTQRLTTEPVVIMSFRHPLEVADSLNRRNGFGVGHGVALWEAYNRALLEAAAGYQTIVVAYPDLAGDPVGTLTRVQDGLHTFGVELAGSPAEAAKGIEPDRRHHVHEDLPESVVTPQQRELWSLVSGLPPRSDAFAAPEIDEPHAASRELIAQRAATLRAEREISVLSSRLRSRRAAVGRLVHSFGPSRAS
jgi:hypothetical protein